MMLEQPLDNCSLEKRKYQFHVEKFIFEITQDVEILYDGPMLEKNSVRKMTVVPDKTIRSFDKVSQKVNDVTDTVMTITEGFLTKLIKTSETPWTPFVCKVEKRLYNKTRQRWFLVVNDGSKSIRVGIGSQCFRLFDQNIVQKGDLIYVKHYAVTKVYENKPRILFLTNFQKVKSE